MEFAWVVVAGPNPSTSFPAGRGGARAARHFRLHDVFENYSPYTDRRPRALHHIDPGYDALTCNGHGLTNQASVPRGRFSSPVGCRHPPTSIGPRQAGSLLAVIHASGQQSRRLRGRVSMRWPRCPSAIRPPSAIRRLGRVSQTKGTAGVKASLAATPDSTRRGCERSNPVAACGVGAANESCSHQSGAELGLDHARS
jgi:hypothetical protein